MVGYAQVYPIPQGRKADVFGDMWKGLWGTLDNQFQALHSHSQVLVWLSFRLTCIKVPRRELVHVHRSGLSLGPRDLLLRMLCPSWKPPSAPLWLLTFNQSLSLLGSTVIVHMEAPHAYPGSFRFPLGTWSVQSRQ